MYNVVICDDSKESILYIKKIVDDVIAEKKLECEIYCCTSGMEFIGKLDKGLCVDLLILDILLGKLDGNEIARIFRNRFPYAVLVFCSGVYKPSVESFKATPYRYILKQQNRQEIFETISEAFEETKRRKKEPYIMTHYRWKAQKVMLRNIIYFQNAKRGSRVIVYSESEEANYKEKLLVDKKPEQLCDELKEYGFALVQSTYLVNMEHIRQMSSEEVVLDNGENLKISRAYKNSFKDSFVKFYSKKYD